MTTRLRVWPDLEMRTAFEGVQRLISDKIRELTLELISHSMHIESIAQPLNKLLHAGVLSSCLTFKNNPKSGVPLRENTLDLRNDLQIKCEMSAKMANFH